MPQANSKGRIDQANISIRTAMQPGDFENIVLLHRALYAEEYGYGSGFASHVTAGLKEFYDQYDEQRDCVWICETGDEFAGSLILMHRGDDLAQLRFFVLKPAFRGQGLGSKLMSLFIERMKNKGYTKAFLWTTSELKAAAALYKKFGFRLSEEKASAAFGKEVIEQRYDLVW